MRGTGNAPLTTTTALLMMAGELIVQVRRAGLRLEGVWRLRTGCDGVITGTLGADAATTRFQLVREGGTCRVLLDGVGKIGDTVWSATDAGHDRQGLVSNGRFSPTTR